MEPVVMNLIALVVAAAIMVLLKSVPFGMMALATTKDTGAIGMGGGNIVYLREVASTGADLGTPDTNHALGHVRSSNINDVPTIVKAHAEDGGQVFHGVAKRDVTLKFELMQRDKDSIGMVTEVLGKYYRVYYQASPNQDGKVNEFLFGLGKVTPKLELTYKEGEITIIPIEVDVLKNAAAITVANNTLPTEKKTANAMDIAAGKYYSVEETTPA
ncbi:MAG: hypothetical protein ACKVRP_02330 [Bacteroidota bacterium]